MKIALGTAQFGMSYGIANRSGRVSADEARAIVARAVASGVDTVDTAISYGDSESRLGEVGVAGLRVVSKLPGVPEDSDVGGWISAAVGGSLSRLRIEALHGLMLHRPDQLLSRHGGEIYRALVEERDRGTVRKIGYSVYQPSELDALVDRYPPDIVQAPLNVLDRRLIDSGWAARLSLAGIELHVRSIFLQGLLLMGPSERPQRFDRWQETWNGWDRWLETSGLTPLQACVRFAVGIPEVDRVVVGVDSATQLDEILAAVTAKHAGPAVPDDLRSVDLSLINPATWDSAA